MSRHLKKGLTWFALGLVCATVMVAFVGLDQATTVAQSLAYAVAGLSALAGMTVFFIATYEKEDES